MRSRRLTTRTSLSVLPFGEMLSQSRLLLAIAIISLSLIPGACQPLPADQNSEPPLYIGLALDVSGSANELPALTREHINRIISILSKRGGALGFALIDSIADEPLLRLALEPVRGRLDERARKRMRNRQATEAFTMDLESKLERKRSVNYTDVNGVVAQMTRFMTEGAVPKDAKEILILVTDGKHTARHNKGKYAPPLPEVTVFAVGMAPSKARELFGERVLLFESVDSVIVTLGDRVLGDSKQ